MNSDHVERYLKSTNCDYWPPTSPLYPSPQVDPPKDAALYLVLELCSCSLRDRVRIDEAKDWPIEARIDILHQITNGLTHLHKQNISNVEY